MIIVMFGAPGVGKGSQASVLSNALGIPHVSTGDIFRENIERGTELGLLVKGYTEQGALVPDELTIGLIMDRILQDDCARGFILDGFPRTLAQAENLDALMASRNLKIDAIINISLEDEQIVARLSGRRICPSCNLVYHLEHKRPERADRCDRCKRQLVQRSDDTKATITKRLEIYHDRTKSLLSYYRGTHRVLDIVSQQDISETTRRIRNALGLDQDDCPTKTA